MAPTDPRRLTILERYKTVIAAIRAGDDYFFKPFDVDFGVEVGEEQSGHPSYNIEADIEGLFEMAGAPGVYDEWMTVHVFGVIYTPSKKNRTEKVEKAIQDVR